MTKPVERPEAVSLSETELDALPLALADIHRSVPAGTGVVMALPGDCSKARCDDLLEGGGFTSVRRSRGTVHATRARTLPDYVARDMKLLFVGLNPSEYAADAGVGFARPGNRFWPAVLEAGIVTRDRDPRHALTVHRVGFTDLVKRATPRADVLTAEDYRHGAARVERLAAWLAPAVVCVVGLTGWRAAVDRRTTVGWQHEQFAGRPVYVMPNTSGVNARVPLAAFVQHVCDASTRATGHSR